MRTLKKSLCLVLAVVMILGLGAFSVNAQYTTKDYSDSKKISHGEAVDVLGAIGVLEGDDNDGDGKIDYRPEDKLTRAQATKIITSMLGVTAVTAVAPFADVGADVAWAKDYIAYCAEQGIVEGVDDENNLFDPQGELTGGAFAKMLLTAMGYDAAIEGMGGTTSWLINVAKLVRTNNLDKGIANFPYDEAITRDDAAQLAFNALCAPLVGYDNKGGTMNVNGVTITTAPTTAHYMTTTVRDTQTISYALVNDGSTRGTYIVEFAEKYQPKLVRVTTDKDDFGRPCTTWTYNREKIGTYVNSALLVGSWNGKYTKAEAYSAIGGDLMNKMKQGNSLSGYYYNSTVYENGVSLVDIPKRDKYTDYFNEWEKNNSDKFGNNGQITEIYIDDDVYDGQVRETQITVVVVDTFLAEISAVKNSKGEAKVTFADSKQADNFGGITLTVKEEDVSNIGDYKEGEKILVQVVDPFKYVDKRDIKVVLPCTIETDMTLTAYTADTEEGKLDSITFDGNTISVACQANWNSDILWNYTQRQLQGFTYDLFKDQFGNLIGIDYKTKDTNYVFITALTTGSSGYLAGGTANANMLFTDGTYKSSQKFTFAGTGTARSYFNAYAATKNAGYTNAGNNNPTFFQADANRAATISPAAATSGHATAKGTAWSGNDTGAIINRWFTYTVNDKNEYTLYDCVGYNTTDKEAQKAVTYDVPVKNTKIDIGASAAALPIGYASGSSSKLDYAFGNDNSVFITVNVNPDPVKGGSIDIEKATSVTGIKNVSISLLNIAEKSNEELIKALNGKTYSDANLMTLTDYHTLNNFAMYYDKATDNGDAENPTYAFTTAAPEAYKARTATINTTYTDWNKAATQTYDARQWNNVFFVYDTDSHYVKYAVCVAQSRGNDVLFITSGSQDGVTKSGVTKSEYVKDIGYVDSYTAIKDGKLVTVQVDRDKSETNNHKMVGGHMYYVDYNADGMVTYVDLGTADASDLGKTVAYPGVPESTNISPEDNRSEGYVYAKISSNADVDVKGNTLYTSYTSDVSKYIMLNSSTNYFVAAAGAKGEGDYTEYKNATSAYNAAKDEGNIVKIYAQCNKDNGFASTVIFITSKSAGTGSSTSGIVDVILPSEIQEVGGKAFTVNSTNLRAGNYALVLYNGATPLADDVTDEVTKALTKAGYTVIGSDFDSSDKSILHFYVSRGGSVRQDVLVDLTNTVVKASSYSDKYTLTAGVSDIVVPKDSTLNISGIVTIGNNAYVDGILNIEEGATVTITKDVLITSNGHINVGKNATLTVNGKTWDGGTSIYVLLLGKAVFNGDLYVTGALSNAGTITAKAVYIDSTGSVSLAGGNFEATSVENSGGKVTFEGGTLEAEEIKGVSSITSKSAQNTEENNLNSTYTINADTNVVTVAETYSSGTHTFTITNNSSATITVTTSATTTAGYNATVSTSSQEIAAGENASVTVTIAKGTASEDVTTAQTQVTLNVK